MTRATEADHNRQSQELTIFHDVAKALTSSLDLDSILQTIMEKMAEYFRPDTWSLLMVDELHDDLYFAIAVGDAAEAQHVRHTGAPRVAQQRDLVEIDAEPGHRGYSAATSPCRSPWRSTAVSKNRLPVAR